VRHCPVIRSLERWDSQVPRLSEKPLCRGLRNVVVLVTVIITTTTIIIITIIIAPLLRQLHSTPITLAESSMVDRLQAGRSDLQMSSWPGTVIPR